jgi:hypothetical protein
MRPDALIICHSDLLGCLKYQSIIGRLGGSKTLEITTVNEHSAITRIMITQITFIRSEILSVVILICPFPSKTRKYFDSMTRSSIPLILLHSPHTCLMSYHYESSTVQSHATGYSGDNCGCYKLFGSYLMLTRL